LYREGILPSGQPLRGELAGGAFLEGQAASCASCHRPSGFGGVEGTVHIPPVVAPALFAPASPDRQALFRPIFQETLSLPSRSRLLSLRERPAYIRDTLAAALREGHDPAGRPFDAPMPRYRLDDRVLDHLLAYLQTLGTGPAPGVEETALHFATVVTPGTDPDRRKAVLDVYDAWMRWKNADIARRGKRPGSVTPMDEDLRFADRRRVLHVWELQGPPETWTRQLEDLERRRPVFAVLGGLGGPDDPWAPIHAFCESREIPCLFPQTDLPVAAPGSTTLYLSAGLTLEAEALARHLRDTVPNLASQRVVQVFRDTPASRTAADAFRRAMAAAGVQVKEGTEGEILVLWLGRDELATIDPGAARRIFLSSSLLGETVPALPDGWRDRAFLLHRRALPGEESPHAFRIRAWLRSRGVERRHEPLQLDAYYTLTLAEEAILRLAGHFSRDLFVENVERETERMPNPGVWPQLVLTPGRRFASQACIVLRPAANAPGGVEQVSGWIVP
ncbi:MAG TPA: hypothetical protein VG477_19030, partial [Thermoanaerobaculia bacterium]|nr:hypothetical protein [Thermoanaerobaculia bacterium]